MRYMYFALFEPNVAAQCGRKKSIVDATWQRSFWPKPRQKKKNKRRREGAKRTKRTTRTKRRGKEEDERDTQAQKVQEGKKGLRV